MPVGEDVDLARLAADTGGDIEAVAREGSMLALAECLEEHGEHLEYTTATLDEFGEDLVVAHHHFSTALENVTPDHRGDVRFYEGFTEEIGGPLVEDEASTLGFA